MDRPETLRDYITQKFRQLESVTETPNTEDIFISSRGLALFREGAWSLVWEPDAGFPVFVESLARQIAENAGVSLGPMFPTVDSYLILQAQKKIRAHAMIPPLCQGGPEITLRFAVEDKPLTLEDFDFKNKDFREEIKEAFRQKKSFLICGLTGSGKTSFAKALLQNCPHNERVVILEDSPEIQSSHPLVSRLLTRSPRFGERTGSTWGLDQLVFESLRLRPDRLVIGECRGLEAGAISQALSTGHEGIITTLHARSPQEALERFKFLATLSPNGAMRFSAHWDCVVLLERTKSKRKLVGQILWNKY